MGKTKAMVCTPGFVWGQHGSVAYKRRETREGGNFRERRRTRVSCANFGGTMAASSLCHHIERSHGIVLQQNRGVDIGRRGTETYVMSFLRILKSVECLVEGCPEREKNPRRLRKHFMYQK